MSDTLIFPDTRSALWDLLAGSVHFDKYTQENVTVAATYRLPTDSYGVLEGPFPIAHIYGAPGGTIGHIDRVDRRVIDVYAPAETAVNVLESIVAFLCGTDIETPSGYLDSIACDIAPEELPYTDTLNKATTTLLVTSRPIN